jgi:aspartate/methionine/tyrosine aminotransferase
MRFQDFELEHYQSKFERTVKYNLADSSVQCVNTSELVSDSEAEDLLNTDLYYPEVNGTKVLRERIASLYPGATPANVLVTVGASQANNIICATLLEPGDEVIVISPGYRQVWGLVKNLGCKVKEIELNPEDEWKLDLDQVESLCNTATKMISVVNPNNPTGSILSRDEMRRIVHICAKNRCWLHADEVYRGTEFAAPETPTFWGEYDRVVGVNSLSKAYGLAGLRIGWAMAAPDVIDSLWRRHEYAVIAASGPSMKLAEIALQDGTRKMLLDRQKTLSRRGHDILQAWIGAQSGAFSVVKPAATSIAFVRYQFDVSSLEMAEHIRKTSSVLVAPGAFLGTEHHLRMCVGHAPERITAALDRISTAVAELAA